MSSAESLTLIINALLPVIAIGATVWGATGAYRAQQKFDRQSDLIKEVRLACANYLTLTRKLAFQTSTAETPDDLKRLYASDDYEKVRFEFFYIQMFCTDAAIRDAVIALSKADDARAHLVRTAIAAGQGPITNHPAARSDYDAATETFEEKFREFLATMQRRTAHQTER